MEIGIYYHKIDYIRDYILFPTKRRIARLDSCIDFGLQGEYQAEFEIIKLNISKLIDQSYEHVRVEAENRDSLNPHIIDFYQNVWLILGRWWLFVLEMKSVFKTEFEYIDKGERIGYCRSWLIKNIRKTFNYQN